MNDIDEQLSAAVEVLLGRRTGPLNLSAVPAGDAAREWANLKDWVRWLVTRYSLDHRVVPPCWYRHPALADLLAALRDHHRAAYDPAGGAAGATEWHRVFADLETRLRDWAARTGCTASAHRDELSLDWPDDTDEWRDHLANDSHRRGDRTAETGYPR